MKKYVVIVQILHKDGIEEYLKEFNNETEARIYAHIKKTYTTNKYTDVTLFKIMDMEEE